MFGPKATAPHLDSTKGAALTTGQSLPVYPNQQTLFVFAGLSQRCQLLTHAPRRRPRSCGDMQAPVMPRL